MGNQQEIWLWYCCSRELFIAQLAKTCCIEALNYRDELTSVRKPHPRHSTKQEVQIEESNVHRWIGAKGKSTPMRYS